MLKCTDADRYYWKSRCFDGINDCTNGEDEQFDNPLCNPMGTTTTVTTSTISPDLCSDLSCKMAYPGYAKIFKI